MTPVIAGTLRSRDSSCCLELTEILLLHPPLRAEEPPAQQPPKGQAQVNNGAGRPGGRRWGWGGGSVPGRTCSLPGIPSGWNRVSVFDYRLVSLRSRCEAFDQNMTLFSPKNTMRHLSQPFPEEESCRGHAGCLAPGLATCFQRPAVLTRGCVGRWGQLRPLCLSTPRSGRRAAVSAFSSHPGSGSVSPSALGTF